MQLLPTCASSPAPAPIRHLRYPQSAPGAARFSNSLLSLAPHPPDYRSLFSDVSSVPLFVVHPVNPRPRSSPFFSLPTITQSQKRYFLRVLLYIPRSYTSQPTVRVFRLPSPPSIQLTLPSPGLEYLSSSRLPAICFPPSISSITLCQVYILIV